MSKTDRSPITTRWLISVLLVATGFAVLLAAVSYILGYDSTDEAMTGYILGILAMATVLTIPEGGK